MFKFSASGSKAVVLMKACKVAYYDLVADYERICGTKRPQLYVIDMLGQLS
jgi:hypothetical protein